VRIAVSQELCSGQGRCYSVAPEVYTADDDGFSAQAGTEFEVPPGLEEQARLGAETCPEGAITILDGA
jgi:ferredoxin